MNEPRNKTLRPCYQKAAGAPSEEQLKAINAFTLQELGAEQVYVRTVYLAHNGIDRDREAFDDALLEDFARTLPGKGLFVRHPGGWDGDSGPGVGRWFAARTVQMGLEEARQALREPGLKFPPQTQQAKILEASFYIPRTAKNADLIGDIDAGVAADVSIGFRASDRVGIQDADGATVAYRLLGPGEALEGSLVWLGAQPGARVVKAARTDQPEETMDKAEFENLKKRVGELEPKAAKYDALVAAIGAKADDAKALAVVLAEHEDFRKQLIADIVKAERLAGLVQGDSDEDVKKAAAAHADAPLAKLKAWHEKVSALVAKGPQIQGSDPAKPVDRKDPDSPLANPLITG